MSTENQELTQIEVDEMLALYEDYAKSELERLKIKRESFKKLRKNALQHWINLLSEKDKTQREIAALQLKSERIVKQCVAQKISVDSYSDQIFECSKKIKQLEEDIAAPPPPPQPQPKKEEEEEKKPEEKMEEEEVVDDFIHRGTGIDISDSEPDPSGLKEVKKNIQLFHDINNAWNQSIREDPELSELLGIDDYEPFGYTSITKK